MSRTSSSLSSVTSFVPRSFCAWPRACSSLLATIHRSLFRSASTSTLFLLSPARSIAVARLGPNCRSWRHESRRRREGAACTTGRRVLTLAKREPRGDAVAPPELPLEMHRVLCRQPAWRDGVDALSRGPHAIAAAAARSERPRNQKRNQPRARCWIDAPAVASKAQRRRGTNHLNHVLSCILGLMRKEPSRTASQARLAGFEQSTNHWGCTKRLDNIT